MRYVSDIVLLLTSLAECEMNETEINRLRRVVSGNRKEIEIVRDGLIGAQHRALAREVQSLLDTYGEPVRHAE